MARLVALEQKNKNLKPTVEEMRMPRARLAQESKQTTKKSDQGMQCARRELLIKTGLILGQEEDPISPIRRLDTSVFDNDEDE